MTGHHISLFTGLGLIDLAAQRLGFETIATAEKEAFCRRVLTARFPSAVHFTDVRDVTQAGFPGSYRRPLLMSGGFPCQGFAPSGYKGGLSDPRSGLWSEFARCIREFKPDLVLIENSNLLRKRGLDSVLRDLYEAGYDARWECIQAGAVGAPHVRDRIWIMARPTRGILGWWAGARWYMHADQPIICNGDAFGSALLTLPRAGEMTGKFLREVHERFPLVDARRRVRALPQSYPTPTLSDGTGGPGTTPRRTGGKNLRTVVNELDGNGRLHPFFVEWLVGAPVGWSDPIVPNGRLVAHNDWGTRWMPRTAQPRRVPDRTARIKALGNAAVPQVAEVALQTLLDWNLLDWR